MTTVDIITDAAAESLGLTYPDLDHDIIVTAAATTAAALRTGATTETVFAPNDDTMYRFLVGPQPTFVTSTGVGAVSPGWREIQHPYFVVLLGRHGGAHDWSGEPVHYTYTAEKWAEGSEHTAKIVSLFLGYLSRELNT